MGKDAPGYTTSQLSVRYGTYYIKMSFRVMLQHGYFMFVNLCDHTNNMKLTIHKPLYTWHPYYHMHHTIPLQYCGVSSMLTIVAVV